MSDSNTEPDDRKTEPADGGAAPPASGGDAGAAPKKRLSARTKLILLVLALIVAAAAIAWFVYHQTRGKYLQATDDATVQADAVTVSPRISGYVDQVLVADNQAVRAGQPLVRISARDYRAQAAQAEAQIAQANAGADASLANIREQQATVAQARAQLAAAQAKAAHDAGEVARYAPLAAIGAETRQQLATLRATAVQSAEDARAQAANVLVQERRIASYRAQVRQGQAQAQAARAQLAAANVDVGATLLRAAINGTVGDKTVRVGQYVQAGTRLMSLVPLDRLYVTANFKETQLGLMRPGQPATVKVDALDGVAIDGHVASVAPGTGAQFSLIPPNNATGNFTKIVQRVPVRIAVDAAPAAHRLLLPGLSVTVTVDTIGAKGELDAVREQQRHRDR